MFNTVTLVGRLARDAEVDRLTGEHRTPRLRFTLAVDRDYEVDGESPTDFWPVEVLGESGSGLAPHLDKGRLVLVHGAAHVDARQDAGGARRLLPFIEVRAIRFLDRQPG
jgi:single-stranded DNA-binding protein